jgi:hypothetical protein
MTDNRTKTLDRALSAPAILTALNEGNNVSPKFVDGAITRIGTMGKKLDNLIHGTAVACIYLSMPHKEGGHNCAARALKLVKAMPKGSRAKALVAWFHAYSNIRIVKDTKSGELKAGVLKPENKQYKAADPVAALANPFWSVEEKDVDPAAFTTDSLVKRVAALIKAAKADNAKLDAAGIAALADLEGLATKLATKAADPLELPIG